MLKRLVIHKKLSQFYKSSGPTSNVWITYIDIDETLKMSLGQGHKVKGHIGIYVKR